MFCRVARLQIYDTNSWDKVQLWDVATSIISSHEYITSVRTHSPGGHTNGDAMQFTDGGGIFVAASSVVGVVVVDVVVVAAAAVAVEVFVVEISNIPLARTVFSALSFLLARRAIFSSTVKTASSAATPQADSSERNS